MPPRIPRACRKRGCAGIRAAQIVSAVYGAQGVKVPLNDALLQWEKEQTEGVSDPFAGLEKALLIVSQ
ncbi:TPA: DUF4035 domain-containing protein [Escherichia coli]